MKILRVIKKADEAHNAERSSLMRQRIDVVDISPTPLSAFTSMKIAKTAEANKTHVVIVERLADAVAAISARRLIDTFNLKIVYAVRPNGPIHRLIPKELIKGVDLWIFASERLKDAYPVVTPNRYVVAPMATVDETAECIPATYPHVIAWIGDITDAQRLKSLIQTIETLDGKAILRISGAGKARDVMPAVKYARTIKNPELVTWVGEEYDKQAEIKRCEAAVRSAEDITLTETEIALSGRPVLKPEQIALWIESPDKWPKQTPCVHDYDRALHSALSTITYID